jgi:CheY-like chemotaxis protein
VIALTALGHADAAQQLHSAGFDAYVRKPIDPFEFAQIIADMQLGRAVIPA